MRPPNACTNGSGYDCILLQGHAGECRPGQASQKEGADVLEAVEDLAEVSQAVAVIGAYLQDNAAGDPRSGQTMVFLLEQLREIASRTRGAS